SWSRIPLLRHQIDALSGVMAHGSQLYLPSDGPPDRREALCRQLAIDPDSSIWSLFPSADEQLRAEPARWQPYSNQLEWIEDSLDYVAALSGLTLLILVPEGLDGPLCEGDKGEQRNELHQACYRALEQRLPANARLVWPNQGISPADLAEISGLGLALGSSAALEVALNGKACVVGAGHFLADADFVRTLHARRDYPALLAELRPRQRPDPETVRQALRFAYLLQFRWNLPFPLVQMPDAETGRPVYTRLEQLGPGREPGLERACRIITGTEPEIAPPLSYDCQIGPEAELAWVSGEKQPLAQSAVATRFESTPAWQNPNQTQRVSVVIPCYNHGHYLADAVHSILHQEYSDVEILIVDDGSTDDTAEVCKRLLAAYPERAIGVLHQANSGQPAIPWSRGMERARGEYFLCLSADDLLSPQTLGAYVDFLDRYPAFSLAYPRVYGFGDMHELIPPQPYDPLQLLRWNFIGGSPLYRRAAWEAAGGLATNVSSHEDWDLWIRFAETGHFGWQVDAATLYFRVHAGNLVQS
ncbi:MAG TPA: glycosyltransferase family A protein, partial [Candidatus Obscuribacterales bacterium]